MNTNNVLIGVLILVVVGFGRWFLFNMPTTPAATPTDTTVPVTTQPQPGLPVVTTDTSNGVSNSTAIVTGKVTPNGSQTSYWYEYGLTEALGSNTVPQAIGSGFISIPTPAYITGLKSNTKYFYRLSAKNSFGTVTAETHFLTTNTTPPPPGSAPTTTTDPATGISRTTANVNGRVDPNSAEAQYWFEWGTTTDLGAGNALQSAGSGTDAVGVSVSLSDLKPSTKYYYRLDAQNKFGTVTGAILSFTTQGPPDTTEPTATTNAATDIAANSATLNAHVDPNGSETKYWFEYSKDSLLGSLIGNGTTKKSAGAGTDNIAVSSPVTGLAKNTKYFYRVVAQSSQDTVRGEILSFTTKP